MSTTALMTTTAPTKPFIPSKMQAAFFQEMHRGSGSIILEAVAGSGKSTTIRRCLPVLPQRAHVLILAFSTLIAADMREGIAALAEELGTTFPNVSARTFHSLGLSAVAKRLGKPARDVESDKNKLRKLFKDMMFDLKGSDPDEQERLTTLYGSFVVKLVSLAKGIGIGVLQPDDFPSWEAIIAHHDLTMDSEEASEETAIRLAHKLLKRSNEVAKKGWIDFDDHLYLPLLWKLTLWQHDYVFVDEAQDVSAARRAIAKKALKWGGRLIAVGDSHQCQPAGTMVQVSGVGEIPIERIRKGDKVMTYANGFFPGKTSQGRNVEDTGSRHYSGELIKIEAGGYAHEVTPNHRCHVRMADRKGSVVYVMYNGKHARVGRCRAAHFGQFGLSIRSRSERAKASWILAFFDAGKEDEARLLEETVAYKYGLPQMTFTYNERGSGSAIREKFWQQFPPNSFGLLKCLNDFSRDFELPFWEPNIGRHAGKKAFILPAINLVDGWMTVCTFNGDQHKPKWFPAKITRRKFNGKVYSLKVQPNEAKRRLYIANGIVTHNSIFGFAGATPDALDLIQREFSAKRMPLTVSYRCPQAAEPLVKPLVPYFEVAESAAEGAVLTMGPNDGVARLGDRDAVLCRNTAPLVELAFSLIAQGRGCTVLGRDIGESLVNLIEKQRTTGIDRLLAKLDEYQQAEVQKFMGKGEEEKADALSDRIACVRVIAGKLAGPDKTVPGLIAKIEAMFSEGKNGLLTLCTAHKAKGKEWKRVGILAPELMPSKFARQEWQQQQELNLMYVAFTRFQEELIFLNGEDERNQS